MHTNSVPVPACLVCGYVLTAHFNSRRHEESSVSFFDADTVGKDISLCLGVTALLKMYYGGSFKSVAKHSFFIYIYASWIKMYSNCHLVTRPHITVSTFAGDLLL